VPAGGDDACRVGLIDDERTVAGPARRHFGSGVDRALVLLAGELDTAGAFLSVAPFAARPSGRDLAADADVLGAGHVDEETAGKTDVGGDFCDSRAHTLLNVCSITN